MKRSKPAAKPLSCEGMAALLAKRLSDRDFLRLEGLLDLSDCHLWEAIAKIAEQRHPELFTCANPDSIRKESK